MNINVSIPLASAIIYFTLIFIIVNSALNKTKLVFTFYLLTTMLWSLSSFFLHADYFPGRTLLIHEFLMAFAFLVPLAVYYFASALTNRNSPLLFILSIFVWVVIVILDFGGYLITDSTVANHLLIYKTSNLYYLCYVFTFIFLIIGVYYIVGKFIKTTNPIEHNRYAYILIGIAVNFVFIITLFFEATSKYPLDHVGNVLTILIFSFAIMRYKLLDIRLIARHGMAYLILILPLVGIYIGVLSGLQLLFPDTPQVVNLIIATIFAIILSLAALMLWRYSKRFTDLIFYRETYAHRQTLLNISNKIGNVINLAQLTDEVLPALCNALRLQSAHLFLRSAPGSDFEERFSYPDSDGPVKDITFLTDNPVIAWLEKKNRSLNLEDIDGIPEFKALWKKESEQLRTSGLGILTPIKNHGELIGIFAIGKKIRNAPYSQEDMEMMMTVAGQAGMIIQNAQTYSQALLKANTDGLTQLYNHRHFHERLDQEISRSSRFGSIFSIILIDIDLFKIYNDNYGHLAGDEILRRVSDYIRNTIRNIDIAARYGGEEFAVILPETRLADAYFVAERIRKNVETKTSQKSMPVTVSLGVASWPMDGVMKEELLSRADKALYLAKKNGRNRTQLSTETNLDTELPKTSQEENPNALSIIYALAATVDAKDHYTYGHSRKVSEYSVAIAEEMKLSPEKITIVRNSGLLHDIGKIGVPDSILNKPAALTQSEWDPIKTHSQLGVDILRHIVNLSACLPVILHHHEHFDGTGYPSGLKGNNIPQESRIITVADAFEAMTSPRAYRNKLNGDDAVKELLNHAGTQFDPEVVIAFLTVLEKNPAWKRINA